MEIKVLEKTDSSIKLRVIGGSQSLLNLLKDEADSVEGISFAGFVIEHPLDRSSVFVIKTESKNIDKLFKKVIDKTEDDLKDAKKLLAGLF